MFKIFRKILREIWRKVKTKKSPHIILVDKFKRYSKFRKNILRTLKKKIPKDLVRIGKITFSNYV